MRLVLQMEKIALPPLVYPSCGKSGFDREPRRVRREEDDTARRRAAIVAITITLTALFIIAMFIYALGTYAFMQFMWSFLSLGQFPLSGSDSQDDGIKTNVGVGEDSASIYVKSEGGTVNIRLIVGGPKNTDRNYDPGGGEEDDDQDVDERPRQPPWCKSSNCDTPPEFPLDPPPEPPPKRADSTTNVPTDRAPSLPPEPVDHATHVPTHQTPNRPPDTTRHATTAPATPATSDAPVHMEPDYLPVPDPWLRSRKSDYNDEDYDYFDHQVITVIGSGNDTRGNNDTQSNIGVEEYEDSDSHETYDNDYFSTETPMLAYSVPDSVQQPLCLMYPSSTSLKDMGHKHVGVLMSWIKSPVPGTAVTVAIKLPHGSDKIISVFGQFPVFGRSSAVQVTVGHTSDPVGGMEVDVSWPRGFGGKGLLRIKFISCQSSYLLSYCVAALTDGS
ncbi:hypothetical protein CRV016 [Nile crocodilepox virus]|uniref:Uncharacterized protein n=1 Tax=Nile crocodilepox virus (isolate Crocodylus niloticus/Zimbabwe/Ume/2001) TaxID=1289473 RepID=Q070N5_CPRVZ|nr:hypothetical protein CRV016 [Nile crocodilepox virus]ABJ08907.1 hypothetical protein CRV016 [Nile crocodilepox virus]